MGTAGPSRQAEASAAAEAEAKRANATDDAAPLHAASQAEAASLAGETTLQKDEAPDAAMLTDRGLAEVHDGSEDDESGQG